MGHTRFSEFRSHSNDSCPNCGHSSIAEARHHRTTDVAHVKRPFGILLGMYICSVGIVTLLSPLVFRRAIYLAPDSNPLFSPHAFSVRSVWQGALSEPTLQLIGLLLLGLGIAQLIFGSTKPARATAD